MEKTQSCPGWTAQVDLPKAETMHWMWPTPNCWTESWGKVLRGARQVGFWVPDGLQVQPSLTGADELWWNREWVRNPASGWATRMEHGAESDERAHGQARGTHRCLGITPQRPWPRRRSAGPGAAPERERFDCYVFSVLKATLSLASFFSSSHFDCSCLDWSTSQFLS